MALGDKTKALYGLSRCTQASLTVTQPVLGALLVNDAPALGRFLVCVLAAFGLYFAMFAANDVLDVRLDRRRLAFARDHDGFDLDSTGARHPLAAGQLNLATAVIWVLGMGIPGFVVLIILSPLCAALSVVAALVGIAYCALATITPYKVVLAGISVAIAASLGWILFAPSMEWPLFALFLFWIFSWEIGGRNLPNDWSDVDEDIQIGIKTVPVAVGPRTSGVVIFASLLAASLAGIGLMIARWSSYGPIGLAGATVAGGYMLLLPSMRLLRHPSRQVALVLFNWASFYPPIVLLVVLASLAVRHLFGSAGG
jgi:4-hydroxybenzoate polyprenyltransferase